MLAEIYPSLLEPNPGHEVKDARQVDTVADAIQQLDESGELKRYLRAPSQMPAAVREEEGLILGMQDPTGFQRAARATAERGTKVLTPLDAVEQIYDELTRAAAVPVGEADPPQEPGVYVFIAADHPCYVGRTSNLKQRIQQHKHGGGQSGHLPATIAQRDDMDIAKARQLVRAMKVRWVVVTEDEDHGVRQAMLELYAAVQLATLATVEGRYNTFKNH